MECPQELIDARRGGRSPDRYVTPSKEAQAALRQLVRSLIGTAPDRAQAEQLARAADFEIVDLATWPGVVLLRERRDAKRGSGAYLLRLGSGSPVVVQTPHTYFDKGTLGLGCALFSVANARALFVDTAHRYRGGQTAEDGTFPADVAHASESMFQAATLGALDEQTTATFVQLHGFAERHHGAAAILSSGARRTSDPFITRVADALRSATGGRVLRYPEDTRELGATTNVQGIAVRAASRQFLHVELSQPTRDHLAHDGDALRGFVAALARSLEPPP